MAGEQKTILVVEDESSLRDSLKDKFESEGFRVIIAENGQAGLDMAINIHPDIILLDIIMPKMDGLTMLKQLRADDRGKFIPVLLLTNLSDNDKISEALQEGAYGYLVKSDWSLAEIVDKVKQKLKVS